MFQNWAIRRIAAAFVMGSALIAGCESAPSDFSSPGDSTASKGAIVPAQVDTPITEPDDPPIPHGEIPPFLPESITLDLSDIPEQVTTPQFWIEKIAAEIQFAGNEVRTSDPHITSAMSLAASIRNDMTGPSQVHVTGALDFNGATVPYVADFSAFDIDGDEVADGSGSAVVEPVALRVWVDRGDGFKRFACALVDVRPSDENLGAGRFITRPNAIDPNIPSSLRIDARWNRIDSAHPWNEVHMAGQLDTVATMEWYHQRLDIRTNVDSSVEKHLQIYAAFEDRPMGLRAQWTQIHFRVGVPRVKFSGEGSGCLAFPIVSEVEGGDAYTECNSFNMQDSDALRYNSDASFPLDFPLKPVD